MAEILNICINQRSEVRFEVDQAVTVTLLGAEPRRCPGRVKDASDRGLAVELPVPVAVGAALEIDLPDAMVLGEAVYCRQSGNSWIIGVRLDQALTGLANIGLTRR